MLGSVRLRIYPEPILISLLPFTWGWAAMRAYRAEDQSSMSCRACGEKLKHVRTMVIVDTGAVIQKFECRCGERVE